MMNHQFRRHTRITDGCWLWTGIKTWPRKGSACIYGSFRFKGKQYRAHRWLYEQWYGPIPEGLELDHLCRNTLCVRPEHLEAVTHQENVRRSRVARRTSCAAGHPYTPENTWIRHHKDGRESRVCIECRRIKAAEYHTRHKHTKYWKKYRKPLDNPATEE